jgi:hypothetical protein
MANYLIKLQISLSEEAHSRKKNGQDKDSSFHGGNLNFQQK